MAGRPVPYFAQYPLWLILWKPIRKFINVAIVPNIPFNPLRILIYRLIGFKIGKRCFIGMKCYMDDADPSLTVIGDSVIISYCVKFAVHGKGQGHMPIRVGDGAYIGLGAIIVSGKNGCVIGNNAVVGAGSVVVRSIPQGSTAVGNPARVIKVE